MNEKLSLQEEVSTMPTSEEKNMESIKKGIAHAIEIVKKSIRDTSSKGKA